MPDDFHILLVEDSSSDVLLIERALKQAGFAIRLTTVSEGAQALDYLRRLRMPDCPAESVPDLILLDLNLPGLDGGQVLDHLKAESALRPIPVVVLTTSGRDEDVWRIYQAGANSYIQKPADYDGYRALVDTLHRYWRLSVTRPPRRPPPS